MLRAALLTAMILALGSSSAAAQVPEHVRTGDQVRVRSAQTSGTFVVVGMDSRALTVRAVDDSVEAVLPFSDVDRLDLSLGPRSAGAGALRGAGMGGLAGGVVGFLVGLAHGSDDPGILSFSAEEKGFMLGVAGGLAGGVLGGVIGMAAPGHRWQRLDLPRVSVAPAAVGGLALRATYQH